MKEGPPKELIRDAVREFMDSGGNVALSAIDRVCALRDAGSARPRRARVAGPFIAPAAQGNSTTGNPEAADSFREADV
jgi:hypothetical protein